MSDMPPEQDTAISQVVDTDQPCTHCGYNLRSLNLQSRCPECGSEVADSLQGDLLLSADKEWLSRLRQGTSVKLWNVALMFLVGLTSSLTGMLAPALGYVVTLLGLLGAGFGVWATFLITTQEPRISLSEQPVTLRRIIRGCACVAVFSSVISNFAIVVIPDFLFALFLGVGQLGYAVASLGELVYYRRFAMRMPDPKLAKSTKRLFWCIIIFCGLAIVAALAMMLSTGSTNVFLSTTVSSGATTTTVNTGTSQTTTTTSTTGIAQGVFMFLGCSVPLLMLFMLLWYVRMLSKYKKAFKEAIEWMPPPSTAESVPLDT